MCIFRKGHFYLMFVPHPNHAAPSKLEIHCKFLRYIFQRLHGIKKWLHDSHCISIPGFSKENSKLSPFRHTYYDYEIIIFLWDIKDWLPDSIFYRSQNHACRIHCIHHKYLQVLQPWEPREDSCLESGDAAVTETPTYGV